MLFLSDTVENLPKVGPKRKQRLEKLGIFTVKDLLYHYPRRYEDRSIKIPIPKLKDGDMTSGYGEIVRYDKKILRGRKSLVSILLKNKDDHFFIKIFNNNYILAQLEVGRKVYFYGKASITYEAAEFINPEMEFDEAKSKVGVIYPLYPATEGMSTDEIAKLIRFALDNYKLDDLEYLNDELLDRFKLMDLKKSIKNIHTPENLNILKAARYRCIFDEFFKLCVFLKKQRDIRLLEEGVSIKMAEDLDEKIESLPFELTLAQKKVLDEILENMEENTPMRRLVQGDVGSGKTIVALLAAYNAIKSGYQVALMVPTQILASQHFNAAEKFFKENNKEEIKIQLLSSSTKGKKEVYKKILEKEADFVVGTHALISEGVEFDNLGLVITDEQHRFGVMQRENLNRKSHLVPDSLLMSATPIPRTLSLVLHGDLDISVIDAMPKGRKKIKTSAFEKSKVKAAYDLIEAEIIKGHQAYIICPLIEDSENFDLTPATVLYEKLKKGRFKNYRLGLLHGAMKAADKDSLMEEFASGKIDILVSTTVIEVGIDVPNATILAIYDAERFGLSQLHQLRGRVGRGDEQSYCLLLHSAKTQNAKERIKTMVQTSDGFEIAEKDLELRGGGEIFGTRQHGQIKFNIADPNANASILLFAKKCCDEIFSEREKYQEIIKKMNQNIYEEIIIS